VELIKCSVGYLVQYLQIFSTSEGTDWRCLRKNRIKKQEEDSVEVEIPTCWKNGGKLARNIKHLGKLRISYRVIVGKAERIVPT